MSGALEQLVELARAAVPQPKKIVNVQIREKIEAVTFTWFGSEFLVNKNLGVLEIRGQTLYHTSASTLMQAMLRQKRKEQLQEAEEQAQKA